MRRLLFILTLFIILVLVGCGNTDYNNKQAEVPDLKITFENRDIEVKKGAYEWTVKERYGSNTIIKDIDSSEKIAEYMEGNNVLPQAKLNLLFSQEPNNVEVIYWGNIKSVNYKFTNNEIVVPREEGVYGFEIIGQWNQGKVSYTIKIIVSS